YRWAENQWDRLPALAADLVRRQVTVFVAGGGAPSAVAAKAATSTIPIVVSFGADPVKLGLVANLNRPGGNITGVTFIATELASKRLDLLREIGPQATTIGFLSDARGLTAADQTNNILAAARALGHQVIIVEARSERDFETAFAILVERKAGALIIAASPLFDNDKLATLAFSHAMPAIYQRREFAEAGGLMSYGASWGDVFRVAGLYVGQILKGAKPSELPFQQSTK